MALIIKEFNQYIISYYTPISSPIVATILCLSNNSLRGTITFYEEGQSLNDSVIGNTIKLEYHEKHFDRILDILRNEKPLYLRYFEENDRGWLITAKEDVGEEEN